MSRLGAALGADPATFMGRRGLAIWCLPVPTTSRVTAVWHDARSGHGCTKRAGEDWSGVEGYRNTKEVRELAHRFGVECQ